MTLRSCVRERMGPAVPFKSTIIFFGLAIPTDDDDDDAAGKLVYTGTKW